jgi:hypothetical protein
MSLRRTRATEKKKRKEKRKGRIIYALNDYTSKSAFEIGERENRDHIDENIL